MVTGEPVHSNDAPASRLNARARPGSWCAVPDWRDRQTLGDAVDADRRRHQRGRVDLALRDQAQRVRKLVRRIAEHVLNVEFLHDAEHRLGAVGFHADPDHDDAGVARRAFEHLLQQAGYSDAFEDQRGLERRQHRLQRRPRGLFFRRHRRVLGPGRVGLRCARDRRRYRRRAFAPERAAPANNRRPRSDAVFSVSAPRSPPARPGRSRSPAAPRRRECWPSQRRGRRPPAAR